MTVAQQYVDGLKNAYLNAGENGVKEWQHFADLVHGVSAADKAKLLTLYPDIPASLVELLDFADGTYFREYRGEELTFYFFGSDVEDGRYPYYLYSAQQLIEDRAQNYGDNFADLFYWYREEKAEGGDDPYGLFVDELFIDFTPAQGGKKGQILRFLHDPDSLDVIADSFDEFLKLVMQKKFAFVQPEFF